MLNAVIDISHHNGKSLDFAAARADGILGVIHKASQGTRARAAEMVQALAAPAQGG